MNEPGNCGEIIAVVYELTKRTQKKLFVDWAQWYKAIFVPNQEPAFARPFGNGSVRVGTQGLFRPCLKTFVAPFNRARLTTPGSPRMAICMMSSFYYYDQDPSGFCFLVQIRAFVVLTSLGLPNLNMKRKNERNSGRSSKRTRICIQ